MAESTKEIPVITFDLIEYEDSMIQQEELHVTTPSPTVSPTAGFKFKLEGYTESDSHVSLRDQVQVMVDDVDMKTRKKTDYNELVNPVSTQQLSESLNQIQMENISDTIVIAPEPKKVFAPSAHEIKREKHQPLSRADSLDEESSDNYQLDRSFGEDGLWFKGHTPLPSESEEEEESQANKLLNYEHEFALPLMCEPSIQSNKRQQLVHNQYSFDEKDFSHHRKSSQPVHSLAKSIIEKKHHKHRKHHHSSKHSHSKGRLHSSTLEKDDEEKDKECVDAIVKKHDGANSNNQGYVLRERSKRDLPPRNEEEFIGRRPKSNTINTFLPSGSLTPVNEGSVLSLKDDSKFHSDILRRLSLQDSLEVPKETRSHHKRKHHHKRHHHARHLQNKQVTLSESLEMRIKSGMQTLEVERKAIREIVTEIEEEFGQKEIDDITSHRFGNFQSSVRHLSQPKRHLKSGMTTHISDVESVCSMKTQRPHMHIDMPEDQIQYAPREGFVELEELTVNDNNELQWKERARWIKFEEDVEKNERWGKPHVASLSFQSLLELRRGLETGTVLLNLDNYDLPTIFESVADNMVITDQLPASSRDRIIGVLLSKHCHHHQNKSTSNRQHRLSVTSLSSLTNQSDNSLAKDSGLDSIDVESADTKLMELESLIKKENGTIDNHNDFSNNHHVKSDRIRSVDDYDNDSLGRPKETAIKFAPITEEPKGQDLKTVSDVKERIPEGAEATSVLVATLNELDRPAVAFVRLAKGCYLGNLTEVKIPIRFLFIIMGPPSNHDYFEIGRSVATLMSDKIFHDLAYDAKNRDDLLAAINSFLDDSIVLAPGDWDRHLLLPLLQAEISEKRRERIKLLKEKAHMDVPTDEQPFLRTGKPFGGLVRDIKKKSTNYVSDFTSGLNLRCLVTTIFIFFATLAPTIVFGWLLGKKTNNNLGVIETLLATSLCGVVFSFTAGQPLIIVGTTGPILVFEQATYELCEYFNIDFMVWRLWIGIFVMIILWIVVALEGCFLVEYFTRFTEEVFSVLISLLFMYESIAFIIKTIKANPITSTTDYLVFNNFTAVELVKTNIKNFYSQNSTSNQTPFYIATGKENIALLSILLLLGTFFIAVYLRKLRFSHFLSSRSRRVLSDFGVPIAMTLMVLLNFTHDVNVDKIIIPHGLRPTSYKTTNRTTFFINPLYKCSIGQIALGLFPAICVSILLFMETELTGVLLNKKKNKLKKGGGYNLDLFVMGGLTGLCSLLGLPWMCAATVRSVQHQNALAIMSRSHAPGERPYLLHIKEQRLTNLCIHVMMGCCAAAYILIEAIPSSVCLGVFLYLGVTSLSGIQFIEQIKLIFVPMKYHPNRKYVRCVKFRSLVTYTLIQLVCLLCLIGIKLTPIAPFFPFFIIGMVFLRRFIERYYTEEELEELDNEDDDVEFEEFDEYGTVLPM